MCIAESFILPCKLLYTILCFSLQLNDSLINKRLEMDSGTEYRWIVPVDYVTNLVDYRDSFIMNKTSSKQSHHLHNGDKVFLNLDFLSTSTIHIQFDKMFSKIPTLNRMSFCLKYFQLQI